MCKVTESPVVLGEQRGVTVQMPPPVKSKRVKNVPTVTMAEVAKHCTKEDLWVVVEGRAYDLTKFLMRHPGGWLPLVNMAGKDATDAFINYHPASVWEKQLPYYHVADVSDVIDADIISGFRELRQNLLDRGLYQTRPTYYLGKAAFQAVLMAMCLYCTLKLESTIGHMLGALFLAVYWQQLAFIGHDAGHNGITHIQTVDNLLGIFVGNFLGGVSIGWWKRSHNVHHIVTNSVEHDPDIQHLPAMAINKDMFSKFWSTYHSKWFTLDPLARILVQYQHFLYYPIMGVARLNLYLQSFILLFSREYVAFKGLEIAASFGFFLWVGVSLALCCRFLLESDMCSPLLFLCCAPFLSLVLLSAPCLRGKFSLICSYPTFVVVSFTFR
jgi:delta8-fatty-acid desaturase